ncbi:MAG: DNA double-strand break repair nuclease NurA [Blastocatellia bacterium]
MIYREKIMTALESRRADFAHYDTDFREQVRLYAGALDRLSSLTFAELRARLAEHDAPGALPTAELEQSAALIRGFAHDWQTHEDARRWSLETLAGRTTFAADGSQILPSKDFSVPVAAVQVAWFENAHTPAGGYVKDVAFEILPPTEILVRTGGATELSEQVVHKRRYGMEAAALRSFMLGVASRGFAEDKPPVVFFDSLLVISFAELLPDEQRDFYVSEIISLLDTSRQTGVPLVGYIDSSYARDLINLLQAAFDLPDAQRISDASLLADRMAWGDRTAFFCCARRGILESYGDEWRRGVGFTYLQTTGDRPPSRLDIPMWVAERGLLDYVVDTVRGEVVVGNGYPYAIEAADQAAVLSGRDRDAFYSLFQEFAEREHLRLRVARKAISKAQRR